ncbi:uncharacterized protein LOC124811034 [Hydra vulgaris]|uniref:uncharacterized protein LOC124811034 n=1 Tax=Hydra vulgaris TaxID=6087 RepID=UPI00019240C6|nr:uncharacterized protein LOC124811034 [Hydra vulgaris]
MNLSWLFLFACISILKTFSKSTSDEQLSCRKNEEGLYMFNTAAGPISCAFCSCNSDLKQDVSYEKCETCCCEYVSKTKINDFKDFKVKDERQLSKMRNYFYGSLSFIALLLFVLALMFIYHRKHSYSSRPPYQADEKGEFMNEIKIATNV